MSKGYVYAFTNSSLNKLVKLGFTKNIEQRLKALSDSTSIPTPFKCYRAVKVNDMQNVEKELHKSFKKYRENPNREYFKIHPEEVDPYFDYLEKDGGEEFDKKTLLEKKVIKKNIDDEIGEQRKKLKKEGKIISFRTNFRIVRYYVNEGWREIVDRGLNIFKNNTNPILIEDFRKNYLEETGNEYEHNFQSHAVRAGIIKVYNDMYQLSEAGLEYKNKKNEPFFFNSVRKEMLSKNDLNYYPYNSIEEILKKVKKINNIEFIWGIYIMKDTSKSEIEKCINRINKIKEISIDLNKFRGEDFSYMISIVKLLNSNFKEDISKVSTDKPEMSDFLGNATSRLDLEFPYLINHMTNLWKENYIEENSELQLILL